MMHNIRDHYFFKLRDKSGDLKGFKTKPTMPIVEYLNKLSQAVRKNDKSKQCLLRPGNRS